MEEKRHTVLHPWHVNAQAKTTDFAGYDMPLYYPTGSRNEHRIVRTSCGLFDVSHMGRYMLVCDDESALSELETIITSPVAGLPVRMGGYGLVCNEDGKVLDDIFIFRLDQKKFLLVVNASNRAKIKQWIVSRSKNIKFDDISDSVGMIALQGPKALEVLKKSCGPDLLEELDKRNTVSSGDPEDKGIYTRTGYTGEDGVEIYAPNSCISRIWEELLQAAQSLGIECVAAGLAARDSLRFEAGFALYGHELSEELTPVHAAVQWACKLGDDQPDFCGKTAILQLKKDSSQIQVLRTVRLVESAVPRQDMKVMDSSGMQLGWVCSGMASPTLDGFFANIFVNRGVASLGTELYLEVRGNKKKVEIVKRPIYKSN